MPRRALITGITGQDGVYLAHQLLACGYRVHGASRSVSDEHLQSIGSLAKRITLHRYDASRVETLQALLTEACPDELYHLAGPSFIPDCIEDPLGAAEDLAMSVGRLLEAVRRQDRQTRVFVAGSSEMFGRVDQTPQNENTPFRPLHPYAVAKVFAHGMVRFYRERHGMFVCMGILFNHESPRRSERFVTRKITQAVARIHMGLQSSLVLGNLEARRDWGFAGDFVRAMWMMLRASQPDDYVIATGMQHSVRDFCQIAFQTVGLDYRQFVQIDPQLYRPLDVVELCGDASRAHRQLRWKPQVSFERLVRLMVEADLRMLRAKVNLPHNTHDS